METDMTPHEIRAEREALGMTQLALAVRLGVTPTAVSRWENGRSVAPAYLALALQAVRAERVVPGQASGSA